jgi:hypothetical protein
MSDQVTKIYELKTIGYDQVKTELDGVAKGFNDIRKAKIAMQKDSSGKGFKEETAEIKKQREALEALKVEEQRLRIEKAKLTNEAKAANIARQAEIKQNREAKAAVDAAAGSYNALNKQFKELYALVKNAPKGNPINFQGQTLGFDQAIGKLKELATAEQDFRRQFSRDSLLVGEYTSGIVQAFKQMGLDDLVGGQIQKAKQRLGELDSKAEELKESLSKVGVSGTGSFQALEKELIDNRNEAAALKQQISGIEQELKSTGDVGSKITGAIGDGFKQLKGQVGQFALSFVGIQAVFNKVTSEISASIESAKQIEGVEAAFQKLNDPALLDNLRKATKGTVSDLELMKSAVNANNFNIPLDKFGKLLEFATRRAKDTGQSVDYLVNSIVNGIGKKSTLVLDNLQISGARIRQAFEGVSVETLSTGEFVEKFSQIVEGEMAAMGADVDTTSEKIAAQKAEWENVRNEIGQNLLPILSALGTVGVSIVSFLAGIPFPVIVAGISSVTVALALYKAEQIRAYIATQLATKQGIIYNAVLLAQRIGIIAYSAAVRIASAATALFNRVITSTPWGLILTAIGLLIPAIAAYAAKAKDARQSMTALNDVNQEAEKIYSSQIAAITSWKTVITSAATSADTKRRALAELIKINPAFSKVLKDQAIDLKELQKAYNEVTASIRLKATAEASAKLTAARKAELDQVTDIRGRIETAKSTGNLKDLNTLSLGDVLPNESQLRSIKGDVEIGGIKYDFKTLVTELGKIEYERVQMFGKYAEIQAANDRKIEEASKNVAGGTQKSIEVDIKGLEERKKGLDEQIQAFQGSANDLTKLQGERAKIQAQLDKLLGTGSSKGSKLSTKKNDPFQGIDALLNANLATLELARAQNKISEETFLKDSLNENQNAIQAKLKLLKGSNSEEVRIGAELKLSKIQLEKETQEKLFELREKKIQSQFDQAKKLAEATFAAESEKAGVTEEEKIQAKLNLDSDLLQAQIAFNLQMDATEKLYNKKSVDNANERAESIKSINRQLINDQVDQLQNDVKVLELQGKTALAKFQEQISAARLKLTLSKPGTGKDKAGSELDKAETRGVLGIEVANLQKLLPKYKELLDQKLITEEQYYQYLKDLNDKAGQLNDSMVNTVEKGTVKIQSLGQLIQSSLSKLFKTKGGSDLDNLLSQTISQSYDLAKDAMNSYFDAEKQRIEDSKNVNIERLDLQKNQLLARAQSKDEELAIEKQFEAKKRAENLKAFEENKRIQRAQAKINLASQLSNLAVIAFSPNPLNIATLGTAGAVLYAVQAAIAIGNYAKNIGSINSAKFEYGGNVPTSTGGKISGPSHAAGGVPFNYEAEGGELAIVRTKNAPSNKQFTISGTHTQIASALNSLGGGKSFYPGAKLSKFEYGGMLGESLQAPVFAPASNSGLQTAANDQLSQTVAVFVKKMDENNAAINKRIDRIKVHILHRDVESSIKTTTRYDNLMTI